MSKIISASLLLFACSFSFANTFESGITSQLIETYFVQEAVVSSSVQVDFSEKSIQVSQNIASELPDAVLRLHDLKKVNFRGEIIYTRSPLELSTLKSHIKTV
ncbi:hypothetical protein [Leeuwenhoekiella sp. NPDC079379]|uniref:hypothetical protein n=1 Tax=Leeuwenhoekiella sp. NPDC079379 TaxID=3364122 RepID=UPI0037C8F257